MGTVVSLGSINIDFTGQLTDDKITALRERYSWFPAPDETVAVDEMPAEIDTLVDEQFIGGKGANQAVAAARAGAQASLCGKVGSDATTYNVQQTITDRGVDTHHIEVTEGATGKAYVFNQPSGETQIAVIEGANGQVDTEYVQRHWKAISTADCLLLQNEIPTVTMAAVLDQLAEASATPTVIFDPAPPAGAETLLTHEQIDIITPNSHEYAVLSDAIQAYTGTVIQKQGAAPLVINQANGAEHTVTPPEVSAVDATGAGDVFAGYLAARLTDGETLRSAVQDAAAAASLSTTREGAQQAIPRADAVETFRQQVP